MKHPLDLLPYLIPGFVLVLGSLFLLPAALITGLAALFCLALFIPTVRSRDLRTMFVGTAAIALVLSVACSNWPLRAAFALARPRFERMAHDVRNGSQPAVPCRVGLFRIRQAEVNHAGVVCLWTDVDASGKSGFVQHFPRSQSFNLWSQLPLDRDWRYIVED